MKSKPQIVYFGSGPVAATSLALLREQFDIEAIITKPTTLSEMKVACPNTEAFSVSTKKELDDLIQKQTLQSNLAILIDFGIIVSQQVINSFGRGIINSHFSLLPEWRGADPITFSLLSGQKKTGVSLMLLSAGMDEGLILAQAEYEIYTTTNSMALTADLIDLSFGLLKSCTSDYIEGYITPIDQESAAQMMGIPPEPSYSRKLTKEDGRIDWTKPAKVIEREIRAYYSWPKSYTSLNGFDVIVRGVKISDQKGTPGKYVFDKKTLTIFCGEGSLDILTIQPADKKEMPISAFLAGYSSRL